MWREHHAEPRVGDMGQSPEDGRLSQTPTAWTLLFQAHGPLPDAAAAARRELLGHYRRPVFRYLCGAVRDPDAAEDLYQEFALRFVRGDFRRAHPDHGRFRDFLRTSLSRLVTDHHRLARRRPAPLEADPPAADDADADFVREWRAELLDRAWAA